jgi:serine/threonine-protein kinase HipA
VLRWILFNAAIGNRDNHGKNLSRLHGGRPESRWRIAPFYDLVNTTSYPNLSRKLPFYLGGAERLEDMRSDNWKQVAVELGIAPALLFREAARLHELIAQQLKSVCQSTAEELGSDARLVAVQRAITKSNRTLGTSLK